MPIFLKFDKDAIKGESKLKGFENQINVDSVQWGCGRGISTVGGGTSRETTKASVSEVTFSRMTDSASVDLFIQACVGKSLIEATLTWVNSGGADNANQVYQVIKLAHPIVSSFSQSSGGDRPSESFSLNFDKVEMQYVGFDGNTKTSDVKKTYNVATGEAK